MSIQILEKRGFPFFLYKRRHRKGLVIGFFLAFLILFIYSGALLTIKIPQVEGADENKIQELLKEEGVYVGARTKNIDAETVNRNILNKMPELSWFSFSRSGTNGEVRLRVAQPVPNIISEKKPCNVVAKYDGVILKCEPFLGSEEVKVGSAVVAGDLLISGIIDLKTGGCIFYPADGNVIAETHRTVTSTLSLGKTADKLSKIDEIKRVYSVRFLDFKIPLGVDFSKSQKNFYSTFINFNGIVLPLGLECQTARHESPVSTRNLGKKKARLICLSNFFKTQMSSMNLEDIKSVKMLQNGETIEAEFVLEENICDYIEIHQE